MLASMRTLGTRPYLVRELAYTLLLSSIALFGSLWVAQVAMP